MKADIVLNPLPYVQRLERRGIDTINLVVIHCTELPDLATARQWGEKIVYAASQTGNSGHYYIDRDGGIQQWVPHDHVAHHVRSFNHRSLGIELVNTGRYPDWFHSHEQQMSEVYPEAQIQALSHLLTQLCDTLPRLSAICGHADLDSGLVASSDQPATMVRRKLDPGPLFPWGDILEQTKLKRVTGGEL